MHQDRTHHYLGSASEAIIIDSSAPSSGILQVSFGGAVLPVLPQTVAFSPNAGDERDMVATLTGAPGSHCALSIANVDGGKDITILNVGEGAFHDTVVLEFVTGSGATQTFVNRALTNVQGGGGRQ